MPWPIVGAGARILAGGALRRLGKTGAGRAVRGVLAGAGRRMGRQGRAAAGTILKGTARAGSAGAAIEAGGRVVRGRQQRTMPGGSITNVPMERQYPGEGGYRYRRQNVGNIKALRRAMRRVESFAKLAKKTISFTTRVKMKKARRR